MKEMIKFALIVMLMGSPFVALLIRLNLHRSDRRDLRPLTTSASLCLFPFVCFVLLMFCGSDMLMFSIAPAVPRRFDRGRGLLGKEHGQNRVQVGLGDRFAGGRVSGPGYRAHIENQNVDATELPTHCCQSKLGAFAVRSQTPAKEGMPPANK